MLYDIKSNYMKGDNSIRTMLFTLHSIVQHIHSPWNVNPHFEVVEQVERVLIDLYT